MWTIRKAEGQRTDASELWCWRRVLRVHWTARRSNQSILKGINPEYSLEGLRVKLKLQYFGHLMWRANSLEKTLMLGKIQGRGEAVNRKWDVGWHHQFNGHEFEQTPRDSEGQGSLVCCNPWGCKELDTTEQLNNKQKRLYSLFSSSHLRVTNYSKFILNELFLNKAPCEIVINIIIPEYN